MTKVSIVIPVYNAAEFIKECLDSATGQTLREIEIICVDDGSTDNSFEIIENYRKSDPRVVLLRQKNQGSGKARNIGIDRAKGEYLAFLDADDFYPDSDTIEYMYKKAIESQANICGGSLYKLIDSFIIKDPNKIEKKYTFAKDRIVYYRDYQYDYGYWRFIYKRDFLTRNNLYFPDYLRGQDPPFFVRAMILSQKFFALKRPTYVYRISHKKVSWTERKIEDIFRSYKDILSLCKENNLSDLYKLIVVRAIYFYERTLYESTPASNLDSCYLQLSNFINYTHLNCKSITNKRVDRFLLTEKYPIVWIHKGPNLKQVKFFGLRLYSRFKF